MRSSRSSSPTHFTAHSKENGVGASIFIFHPSFSVPTTLLYINNYYNGSLQEKLIEILTINSTNFGRISVLGNRYFE